MQYRDAIMRQAVNFLGQFRFSRRSGKMKYETALAAERLERKILFSLLEMNAVEDLSSAPARVSGLELAARSYRAWYIYARSFPRYLPKKGTSGYFRVVKKETDAWERLQKMINL